MAKRNIRPIFTYGLIGVAILFLLVGIVRTHTVYEEKDSCEAQASGARSPWEEFSPEPKQKTLIPHVIRDYELVIETTFSGVERKEGKLVYNSTVSGPSRKGGKRACPT